MKLTPIMTYNHLGEVDINKSKGVISVYDVSKKFDLIYGGLQLPINEAHAMQNIFEVTGIYEYVNTNKEC
jgi:hypothetical protein